MGDTRIIVHGASGRMGQEIIKLIDASKKLSYAVGISSEGPIKDLNDFNPVNADVVIDFSLPDGFNSSLAWCIQNKIPFVSGTTGLSDDDFISLEAAAKSIPVLWAPNMSVGVATLNYLLKGLGTLKEEFDFQIEEFHHKHKVDKPSGTGKFLQESLKDVVGNDVPEVLSIRGGGIFGIHKVWAMSEEETICLEHVALNRGVFAKGALRAAEWLKNQKPGKYTINNVLGLN